MPSADGGPGSIDLSVRGRGTVLIASGIVPIEGAIALTGVLMDATDPRPRVDVRLTVDHEQRNVGERITRVDQDVVRFVQENGEEFREQITDFSQLKFSAASTSSIPVASRPASAPSQTQPCSAQKHLG